MKIRFSRHAKRRTKLYKIQESTITNILNSIDLPQGEHEITKDVKGLTCPLKIVVYVEDDIITVITNYPLKKKVQK
ncbi:MAG: hypothetical protein AAB090_06245 [Nitrospirota bacterium]